MTRKLKGLYIRAKDILQTEGLLSLFKRGINFLYWRIRAVFRALFEYEVVYLYEHTIKDRDEADFLPRMQDFSPRIISSQEEADELADNGIQDFREYWRDARKGLDEGGVAFCVYSGHDLAHIGWIAMNSEAKKTFDYWPYNVDFVSNQACTGGTWTSPKYRGKGLMAYGYFKRFEYLQKIGVKTTRNAVAVDNAASHKVHAKFGPRIYAKARFLRIWSWFLKNEKPLSSDLNIR